MRSSQRIRVWAPTILFALVILLIAANLIKRGLSPEVLVANKDGLAAISDLVTLIGVVVASGLGYFRFFRGRTFVSRANMDVAASVTRMPTGGDLFHSIVVKVTNIGTFTLWGPALSLTAVARRVDGTLVAMPISDLRTATGVGAQEATTIDPGESASFLIQQAHSSDTWMVTYTATLALPNGRSWTQYLVVENKPAPLPSRDN